jgi:hypothetical protein
VLLGLSVEFPLVVVHNREEDFARG